MANVSIFVHRPNATFFFVQHLRYHSVATALKLQNFIKQMADQMCCIGYNLSLISLPPSIQYRETTPRLTYCCADASSQGSAHWSMNGSVSHEPI